MIPGQTIGKKGIATDGTYIYVGNLDPKKITNNKTDIPFSITVYNSADYKNIKSLDLNKAPQSIELPFRFPMMIHKSINLSSLNSFLSTANSDFGPNYPTTGNYHELTTTRSSWVGPLFKTYQYDHNYIPDYNILIPAIYSKQLSSAPLNAHACILLCDNMWDYPTSISIQAVTSDLNHFLYITYNIKVKIYGSFYFVKFYNDLTLNTTVFNKIPDYTINEKYLKTRLFYTWETPVIAKYQYNGQNLTFNSISFPTASYNRKVFSSSGDYSWNAKVIPYRSVDTTTQVLWLKGEKVILPSSNRCFLTSIYDTANSRMVVASVYEESNGATFPDEPTLYLSYHSTVGNLTFIPTNSCSVSLKNILRTGNSQYNPTSDKIDNIHKIAMCRFNNSYVIAISYDTNQELYTMILKINNDDELTSTSVELVCFINNAGFMDIEQFLSTYTIPEGNEGPK